MSPLRFPRNERCPLCDSPMSPLRFPLQEQNTYAEIRTIGVKSVYARESTDPQGDVLVFCGRPRPAPPESRPRDPRAAARTTGRRRRFRRAQRGGRRAVGSWLPSDVPLDLLPGQNVARVGVKVGQALIKQPLLILGERK